MRQTVCVTSFDFEDLAPAKVLAETVKAAHPDWTMQAIVIEEPGWTLPEDAFSPFDTVHPAAALGSPRFRPWMFSLDKATTPLAVAARALRHGLDAGADQVIYLSADSAVFHPLDLETGDRADASVMLAPQQVIPSGSAPARRDGELAAMRLGVFSPGFIVVRNDPGGRAFAAWFDDMARRPIADSRLAGAPATPLLCNLAPALFSNLHILRDPGYNVGAVNIEQRRLCVDERGDLTANGAKLRHIQFPRPGSASEAVMDRNGHGDIALYELIAWHRRQTARAQRLDATGRGWSFAAFADGTPITPAIRRLWRERADLYATFEDPFATGPGTLQAWIARERPDLLAGA
jgi:hypothetical protein